MSGNKTRHKKNAGKSVLIPPVPPRFLFDLAQLLHKLLLHFPNTVEFLSHVLKISVIHAAGAVSLLCHLIEIVADAVQVSAHFPQGGIVHLQDISVNRHFTDIGFPVVRMDFLHPFMNHVKLFRGDASGVRPSFPRSDHLLFLSGGRMITVRTGKRLAQLFQDRRTMLFLLAHFLFHLTLLHFQNLIPGDLGEQIEQAGMRAHKEILKLWRFCFLNHQEWKQVHCRWMLREK